MKVRNWLSRTVLVLALIAFLDVTVWLNLRVHTEQQFAFLAGSFLHGNLAFSEPPGGTWADTTPHQDKHYWPLGPFPTVLLMPFQFAASFGGGFFYQGYLQIVLVGLLLLLVFGVSRRTGFDAEDAAYLAFGFAFSTAFLGVAFWPWSWYFSHVITCVLVFAAIFEMCGKRRGLVIGTLFSLCLATRATAVLGLIWFVGELFRENRPMKDKLWSLAAAVVPCIAVTGLLFLYNYARFGNIFDQGYAGQIVPDNLARARNIGLFSIHHLPANLHALLLAGPVLIAGDNQSFGLTFPFVAANPWGMSLLVTSPYFFLLAAVDYRDTTSRWLLLTAIIIALPILFYYGIGFRQFGYRYSLDFLPLLYYLLLRDYWQSRKRLTAEFKVAIILCAICNLYLFAGLYLWNLSWNVAAVNPIIL